MAEYIDREKLLALIDKELSRMPKNNAVERAFRIFQDCVRKCPKCEKGENMDKELQIDEIVKIICPVYMDGAKCTFNERQFGKRKCANPCTVRTTAEQLIDAGYRPEVQGEWEITVIKDDYNVVRTGAPHCSVCKKTASYRTAFCPNCGAKMDGGMDNG